MSDIAETYKKAVAAFYNAGCRYLQMDDIFFAYLCDPKHRADKQAEGFDPDWLIDAYAKMMNTAIKDRPDDMVIAMHLCRGNFRSTHAAEGSYDPAADAVFNQTDVDIYFMEYDTEEASKYADLEQMGIAPQCGFASTEHGNELGEDEQKRKLELLVKTAEAIWGGVDA